MSTLKLNTNNDIFLSDTGNLVLLTKRDAIMQDCDNFAKSLAGEMVFQTDVGVDYFGSAFGVVSLPQFRASLYENLIRVSGVVSIQSLDVFVVGDTVNYIATIVTEYGTGTIS